MYKDLKTVIIGAGGQARIIREIFELNKQNFIGYISSEPKGSIIQGFPVLCSIEELALEYKNLNIEAAIISIGDNYKRYEIYNLIKNLNIKFINAIHPRAIVSKYAQIGNGVLINAGAVIQTHSIISNHVNIGTSSSIDHDCIICDFVNIAPQATLCGNVKVENKAVIGPNSVILEKTVVGEGSLVAGGTTVIKDVKKNIIVVGNPARYLKSRDFSKTYLK